MLFFSYYKDSSIILIPNSTENLFYFANGKKHKKMPTSVLIFLQKIILAKLFTSDLKALKVIVWAGLK